MAPVLSQSEIQEITRLMEQGKALPEKYRDILFGDRQLSFEDTTPGEPEPTAPAGRPVEPEQPQRIETNTASAFSLTAFVKFLLDDPRIQQMIGKYAAMVDTKGLEVLANDCTSEIIETVSQILEQSGNRELRLRWRLETNLRKGTRNHLHRVIREGLTRRQLEKEDEAAEGLLTKYADLVNMFLDIAERKVSVLDEYGDERLYLLNGLVDECVAKIAGREGGSEIHIMAELKKGGIFLHKRHKELLRIRKTLPAIFAKYHAEQKSKRKTIEELASLSGVDFETAVGRVLLEHGWHVSATAATGDQGADIIASKGERRVIIQAKRYSGPVGNKAVQEVVGAILFYGGTEGCVVTNSTFTPAARALAQKNNIRLIDGSRFGEIGEL